MTIRTTINFGRWHVVKHFKCEVCKEHFFLCRNLLSGFEHSKVFGMECGAHLRLCLMEQKAKELMYETKD